MQIKFSNPVGCSGHQMLGWRNIWDSAEHWSWVERSQGAGEIELRVLSELYVLSSYTTCARWLTPTHCWKRRKIKSGFHPSPLSTLLHRWWRCDVQTIHFNWTFFYNFFFLIWIWMTLYMQERSLRDNSSLVTVTRNDLYLKQFVSISIASHRTFFKFQQERSYGKKQYGTGGNYQIFFYAFHFSEETKNYVSPTLLGVDLIKNIVIIGSESDHWLPLSVTN